MNNTHAHRVFSIFPFLLLSSVILCSYVFACEHAIYVFKHGISYLAHKFTLNHLQNVLESSYVNPSTVDHEGCSFFTASKCCRPIYDHRHLCDYVDSVCFLTLSFTLFTIFTCHKYHHSVPMLVIRNYTILSQQKSNSYIRSCKDIFPLSLRHIVISLLAGATLL